MKYCVQARMALVFIFALFFYCNAKAQSIDEIVAGASRPHTGLLKQYASDESTNQKFQDSVDPYSGNLEVKVNGLSLPGNGGLNINVDLSYKMEGLLNAGASRIAPHTSAVFDDKSWSAGPWNLNFAPRIAFYAGGNNPSGDYDLCNPPPYTPGYGGALVYGFSRISLEFD